MRPRKQRRRREDWTRKRGAGRPHILSGADGEDWRRERKDGCAGNNGRGGRLAWRVGLRERDGRE
jgi:hypothetical protein